MSSLTENQSFLSHPSDNSNEKERLLVVFGGYSNSSKECYNDLHVLCAQPTESIQRKRKKIFETMTTKNQNQNITSSTSSQYVDPTSYATSDPCYSFSWRDNIIVTGTSPEPRLAHSATVLRPISITQRTNSTTSLIVIFGGVGMSKKMFLFKLKINCVTKIVVIIVFVIFFELDCSFNVFD